MASNGIAFASWILPASTKGVIAPEVVGHLMLELLQSAAGSKALSGQDLRSLASQLFEIRDIVSSFTVRKECSEAIAEIEVAETLWENKSRLEYLPAKQLSIEVQRLLSRGHIRLRALAVAYGMQALVRDDTRASHRSALFFLTRYSTFHGVDDFVAALCKPDPWVRAEYEGPSVACEIIKSKPSRSMDGKVSGWVTRVRRHASVCFVEVTANEEIQQVAFEGNLYGVARAICLGDFVTVRGQLRASRRGSIALFAEEFAEHKKSYSAGKQQFLNLWKEQKKQSLLRNAVRETFDNFGFLEVQTPTLSLSYEGGLARPFVTFENATKNNLYLKVSSELAMIKYIAGGATKVFEIGPSFRNEARRGRAGPEFSFLEAYSICHSLSEMRGIFCRLVSAIVDRDIQPVEVTFETVFRETCGFDYRDASACSELARALKLTVIPQNEPNPALSRRLFKKYVSPRLIGPLFVTHIPGHGSPFIHGEGVDARRVWFNWNGRTIAEIAENETDSARVSQRLVQQFQGDPFVVFRDYVETLGALAMSPAAIVGMGIGLERLLLACDLQGGDGGQGLREECQ